MAVIPRMLDRMLESMRPKGPISPSDPLGVSGTPAYGGWLVTYETHKDLVGRERYRTFSNILVNTSIVSAAVRYYLNLLAKPNWKVEPAKDAGADGDKAAEIVERAIAETETPWPRIVRRLGMFTYYGFAISEWTARAAEDGVVLLQDIESRPQITIERWDVDEGGVVAGVLQRAPRDSRVIYLPREKLVYAVNDALDDSPEGLGLLRHLAEPVRRLERYLELEGFGFEGDLRGMPIVRAPVSIMNQLVKAGKMSKEERDAILLPMRNFLQQHVKNPQLGLMLDSQPYTDQGPTLAPSATPQWDVDVGKQAATGQAEVAAAIERLNRECARIVGVEHLMLGGDGKGSMALSRDKSDRFALEIDSALTEIAAVMEKDICRPLMKLNGLPEEAAPKLKTDATAYRDIEQVTTALLQMAQAGAVVTPNDPAVNEVRDLLGLSRPEHVDVQADASGEAPAQPVPKPGARGQGRLGFPAKPAPGEAAPAAQPANLKSRE